MILFSFVVLCRCMFSVVRVVVRVVCFLFVGLMVLGRGRFCVMRWNVVLIVLLCDVWMFVIVFGLVLCVGLVFCVGLVLCVGLVMGVDVVVLVVLFMFESISVVIVLSVVVVFLLCVLIWMGLLLWILSLSNVVMLCVLVRWLVVVIVILVVNGFRIVMMCVDGWVWKLLVSGIWMFCESILLVVGVDCVGVG